jgi:hypothetical protein
MAVAEGASGGEGGMTSRITWLPAGGYQTRYTSRPPGRSARPLVMKAATGSPKNNVPVRGDHDLEAAPVEGGIGASTCAKSMMVTPCRAHRRRAPWSEPVR